MSGTLVVGYDGSQTAERALAHAVEVAKKQDARIVLVHVLEWSPYSFLTPEELEERHSRRKEELARAESAVISPVKSRLEAEGLSVETQINYGHTAEILMKVAQDRGASQIVVGRDGHGGFASRFFGSTAATLVQLAPVPCTIVP